MLTPGAPPAPYLDRVLGWLAPGWQLRRLKARAALAELQADLADPSRVRQRNSEVWRRIDEPPTLGYLTAPRQGGYRLVR
jgi:hypothetical protein